MPSERRAPPALRREKQKVARTAYARSLSFRASCGCCLRFGRAYWIACLATNDLTFGQQQTARNALTETKLKTQNSKLKTILPSIASPSNAEFRIDRVCENTNDRPAPRSFVVDDKSRDLPPAFVRRLARASACSQDESRCKVFRAVLKPTFVLLSKSRQPRDGLSWCRRLRR